MPEARDWAARISSAALARSVMLVGGSQSSTTRTDNTNGFRKLPQEKGAR